MFEKVIVKLMIGAAAIVCGAVGYDIYEHRKIGKKLDMSCKELEKASVQEIQESLVEQAVKYAAQSSVYNYMERVHGDVMLDAKNKISEEARKAVKDAAETIRKEVGDRISNEAAMIDMASLKKSARDAAEAKILEKFDGNLEDLLAKFNDNLSNVQKIYGGIADAITKTKEKDNGIKFTIG